MRRDKYIPLEDHLRCKKEKLDLERSKEALDEKITSTTTCL